MLYLGGSGGNAVQFCLGAAAGVRLPDEDMCNKTKLSLYQGKGNKVQSLEINFYVNKEF